ncbi:MAG: hypothetical protein K2W96_23590 [Gemmataceae bacterium]|nr:hypothetical protein [Gemmataceae bacterium]
MTCCLENGLPPRIFPDRGDFLTGTTMLDFRNSRCTAPTEPSRSKASKKLVRMIDAHSGSMTSLPGSSSLET